MNEGSPMKVSDPKISKISYSHKPHLGNPWTGERIC